MKKAVIILALAALPGLALAQSVIDGTWKLDSKSMVAPDQPSRFLLKDGTYDCITCIPRIRVKADGKPHRVKSPFFDKLTVTIAGDKVVDMETTKDGKLVGKTKVIIADDGKSYTREFTVLETSGITTTSKVLLKRVGDAPKGAHPLSGAWRMDKFEQITETTVTYKTTGNVLAMTSQEGASYEAKLDGTPAPVKGDPGTEKVSVKMTSKDTFEETSYLEGKVSFVMVMKVAPDGKRAEVTWVDTLNKSKGGYTLVKQ